MIEESELCKVDDDANDEDEDEDEDDDDDDDDDDDNDNDNDNEGTWPGNIPNDWWLMDSKRNGRIVRLLRSDDMVGGTG
jgi:hypothetical protein